MRTLTVSIDAGTILGRWRDATIDLEIEVLQEGSRGMGGVDPDSYGPSWLIARIFRSDGSEIPTGDSVEAKEHIMRHDGLCQLIEDEIMD